MALVIIGWSLHTCQQSTSQKREVFAVYSALNSNVHPVCCDKDALREWHLSREIR